MSELTDLIELWQQDPEAVKQAFRENEALRLRVVELGDTLDAGSTVSAGGFALYYAEQYGRKMPTVVGDVAEEFSWAYHNRKGVIFEGWRGFGKSTFFTAWCPYVMGVNPVGSTLLVRINDAAAKAMGKTISDVVMLNTGFKKIFPNVLPDERAGWSVEAGFEVFDTRVTGMPGSANFESGYAKWRMMCLANHLSEKSLMCNGVESGSNIGMHPTNGEWFDDLNDENNTTSPAELKKINNSIKENFVPTWFSAGGSPTIGMFCTPWLESPPDARRVMLNTGLFKHVRKPIMTLDPNGEAIPETTSQGEKIDPEWAGKKVRPTWRENFGVQKIADIIRASGTAFGRAYMLDVNMSRPKKMRYQLFPHNEIRWNEWEMTLGVDPVTWIKGISTGEGVSHFAAYQLLKTPYNTLVIAGGVCDKLDALEGQEYVAETQRTFSRTYRSASIEKNGGGVSFIAMLTRNRGVKYHGHEVSELGQGSKKKRQYDFLQPLMACGAVQVSDEETPELDYVRDYFDMFPNFPDDSPLADVGDAICMGVLDIPAIWSNIVTKVVTGGSGSIWNMRQKQADPYAALLEGRR
jgi:hypothetical protein